MTSIENLVTKVLEKNSVSNKILSDIIKEKFLSMGITLNEKQIEQILQHLTQGSYDNFQLDVQEKQIQKPRAQKTVLNELILELTEDDLQKYKRKYEEATTEVMSAIVEFLANPLFAAWKKQAKKLLKEEQKKAKSFSRHITEMWEKPLKLLEMLISICLDAGASFAIKEVDSPENLDPLKEVLIYSHARACQVSSEILTLLSNGFADGAYARWRALHEITVISIFIATHGKETAEKYAQHKIINDYKEANQYQKYCHILGFKPLPEDELDTLKQKRDQLIQKFGKGFKSDYGWATDILKKERPTLYDIEHSIDLNHLRFFYQSANLNVHASARSMVYRFGTDGFSDEILLAGKSIYGLTESGQHTAYSLSLITSTLMLSNSDSNQLAFTSALQKLRDEVFEAFDNATETLSEE